MPFGRPPAGREPNPVSMPMTAKLEFSTTVTGDPSALAIWTSSVAFPEESISARSTVAQSSATVAVAVALERSVPAWRVSPGL